MPASSAAVDDPLAGLHPDVAEVVRVCAGIEVRRLTSPRERETSLELARRVGGAHSRDGEAGAHQGDA